MVNVLGDSYGASIVAHLSRHDVLKPQPPATDDKKRSYNTSNEITSSPNEHVTSFQSGAENASREIEDAPLLSNT